MLLKSYTPDLGKLREHSSVVNNRPDVFRGTEGSFIKKGCRCQENTEKYLSEFGVAFRVHWSSALHHHRLHNCFQENTFSMNRSIHFKCWRWLFFSDTWPQQQQKPYLHCFLLGFLPDSCFVLFFSSSQVAPLSPPLPL